MKDVWNAYSCLERTVSQAVQLQIDSAFENRQFTAHFYSSPRIRQNRRSFMEQRQRSPEEHKQQIKRYSQLLSKKKQQQKQGGLDSFWWFKKDAAFDEKKQKQKKQTAEDRKAGQIKANRVQQAFSRIFVWGKLPVDLESGLISKILFKNYLTSVIGECFADWFLNFFQVRSYINFKEFQKLGQKIAMMSLRQSHLVSFMLYDRNNDGFICPRDVFSIFEKQLDPSIESDIIAIGQFAKDNQGREEEINQQFKIEHVVIQDAWITIKDYEVFFKKMDEPFLKATNKKDTGFSKTFAVLQHREKIRSTRRELNQKKMMYNELFRQIARDNKNTAFVELQDYRLNYTFLYQIFSDQPTRLFLFFCSKILGVSYQGKPK